MFLLIVRLDFICFPSWLDIQISGLPPRHDHVWLNGVYVPQGRQSGGRATYKGGLSDDVWLWYYPETGEWLGGLEASIGGSSRYMSGNGYAKTPDKVTTSWEVLGGFKKNKKVKVERQGNISHTCISQQSNLPSNRHFAGSGLQISGLDNDHRRVSILGTYTLQSGQQAGKPTYVGGRGGTKGVWYTSGRWTVGPKSHMGTTTTDMKAEVDTATPDAVTAGKWELSRGMVANANIKCKCV
jgi:hypothetical protein